MCFDLTHYYSMYESSIPFTFNAFYRHRILLYLLLNYLQNAVILTKPFSKTIFCGSFGRPYLSLLA